MTSSKYTLINSNYVCSAETMYALHLFKSLPEKHPNKSGEISIIPCCAENSAIESRMPVTSGSEMRLSWPKSLIANTKIKCLICN